MGFTIETGISALTVFVQGLLSFFSPCVLPLVPLYLGYLAGGLNIQPGQGTAGGAGAAGSAENDGGEGEKERGLAGKKRWSRDSVRLFIRVLCFTAGIGGAFFVLGLGASALGTFFQEQRRLFAGIGGILVMLFGLYQLGVFGSSRILGEEHRIPLHLDKLTMSPVTAFIMGFAFSFAWTPCVGPALTSVLLMAGSADSSVKGFFLIGVYTLGFILPFLAAGIFTAKLLGLFKKHMKVVKYTVKAGGVLMILMGLLMYTGKLNDITGYLSTNMQAYVDDSAEGTDTAGDSDVSEGSDVSEDAGASGDSGTAEDPDAAGGADASGDSDAAGDAGTSAASGASDDSASEDGASEDESVRAYEFELTDQYGNVHTLDQYKGKVIFLNFWATWCGPCRNEMPEIQKLYEEYAAQGDDAEVVILGAAAPDLGNEGSKESIISFMEENGYTYPVLLDENAEMFSWYQISAFPTTFMIDRDGNVYGYVTGQLTEDIMRSIIDQTLSGESTGE